MPQQFPLLPSTLRWLNVAIVAGILIFFSLLTTTPTPPEPGPFWDKKLHLVGYATLGLSLIYATASSRLPPSRRVVPCVGATVLFGVVVELLQGPLPYRYFSYVDILANALGAGLASGWFLVERRLVYVRFPRRQDDVHTPQK